MENTNYEDSLSVDEKILMAVIRTAEIFKRTHAAIFRNYGLSFSQYNVLRVLEGSPNRRNKIITISRIMLVPNANITGIAKRLDNNGFIVKKTKPGDKRVTILELTSKGIDILGAIEEEKDSRLASMLEALSTAEKKAFLQYARRLIKQNIYGI